MQYPLKKSFAAELLKKRQKKRPSALLVVAVIVAIAAVGYALYIRFGIKEIPTETVGFLDEEITEEKKFIAVKPFENLNLNKEYEWFSDGIHDIIITHLSKIGNIGVISRTSVMKYKETDMTIPEIGKELGVAAILEGTVQRSDSRVRISTQLIDVKTEDHIWADYYDRDMEDIFAIQSDVAQKIADALKATISSSEKELLEKKPTENLEAYDYYLRGNDYRGRNSRIAIQMYQKAIDLDPAFAQAYARLSITNTLMFWTYSDRTPERLASAKEAVDRALELNTDLPEAHLALGFYYYRCHLDYDRALEQFNIVLKSQPNNSELLAAIGWVQRRQGKFEEALANIIKASELDPLSSGLAWSVGNTFRGLRNYPEAERYYNRAISLAPDFTRSYANKAMLYIRWEGNTEKARAVLEEALKNFDISESFIILYALVTLDMYDENYQDALDRLSLKEEDFNIQEYFIPYDLQYALIYSYMNKKKLAQEHYDSSRIILETRIQEQPEDARFHSSLGIAYAGLGRKEGAIREGKLAVALLPVNKGAPGGLNRIEDLARIYVMVGEYDSAIDQLEFLLSRPGFMTVHVLRLDPIWAPLREHPRFTALLKKMGLPED